MQISCIAALQVKAHEDLFLNEFDQLKENNPGKAEADAFEIWRKWHSRTRQDGLHVVRARFGNSWHTQSQFLMLYNRYFSEYWEAIPQGFEEAEEAEVRLSELTRACDGPQDSSSK